MSALSADPTTMANAIRFLSLAAIERAGDGHPGAPLGCADLAAALWTRELKHNPADPLWFDRDRFVLSNGHGSMLIYSLLHLTGYAAFPIQQLRDFRTLGAHTAGHPERDPAHGIEVTTGPLGQGIANAAGMAVAESFLRAWLGEDLVDHHTYAIVGDGCLQEGVGQEIISLAGHLRLGRLTFLWDDNRITDDGVLDIAQTDDMIARFALSGWHTAAVDGHDIEAVARALAEARLDPRPSMIACRTTIGRGIPRVQGQRAAHGGRVFAQDYQEMAEALGWTQAPFELSNAVRDSWLAAGRRSLPAYDAWQSRVAALPPDRRALLDRLRAGELPADWAAPLHAWRAKAAAEGLTQGGINSSADLVEILSAAIPEMIAGAPDLEGPTQHKRRLAAFGAADPGGRYVHYGVREHAMGSMLNGMAAHGGVVPLGVTYLVFSDYERPAIRMAALMSVPSLFVFSHDSIGVGRNGPTHQPVEYLASLRAIPNLLVFRPADAVEAADCWELALTHRDGPSALIFSRQPLPPVRRDGGTNRATRGAYVLAEGEGGPRRVTLLATGSEVALALSARDLLLSRGISAAVVSMPCWELFERQDDAYRAAVLGRGTVRIAVEAAVRQGWDRWIGEDGVFIGMSGFGASGPETGLYAHFGITAERVTEAALARL